MYHRHQCSYQRTPTWENSPLSTWYFWYQSIIHVLLYQQRSYFSSHVKKFQSIILSSFFASLISQPDKIMHVTTNVSSINLFYLSLFFVFLDVVIANPPFFPQWNNKHCLIVNKHWLGKRLCRTTCIVSDILECRSPLDPFCVLLTIFCASIQRNRFQAVKRKQNTIGGWYCLCATGVKCKVTLSNDKGCMCVEEKETRDNWEKRDNKYP